MGKGMNAVDDLHQVAWCPSTPLRNYSARDRGGNCCDPTPDLGRRKTEDEVVYNRTLESAAPAVCVPGRELWQFVHGSKRLTASLLNETPPYDII